MHRRHFLRSGTLAAATLGAGHLLAQPRRDAAMPQPAPTLPILPAAPAPSAAFAAPAPLAPIRASADRIVALHACTRPFRAQGPRI